MRKRIFLILTAMIMVALGTEAQEVTAVWSLSDKDNLANVSLTGDNAFTSLLTPSFTLGSNLTASGSMTKSGADTENGYTAVDYGTAFTQFAPSVQVSSRTTGHSVSVALMPADGHKFKPTKVSFDVARCGTDAGTVEVCYKKANGSEVSLGAVTPLRNKIMEGNSVGYTHCDLDISNVLVDGYAFTLEVYVMGISTTKSMALRNMTITGAVDDETGITGNIKGKATPLKRGLIAINLTASGGSGNLISWRSRKSDGDNYKFKLYRGTSATTQATKVNSGKFIMGKTNFSDASGTTSSYYKLEVYDDDNNLIETEVSEKAWDGQVKYVSLEGGAPTDPTSAGATYTPNDASFCDMDGDGEYEIVLKWSPSNEKDAASSGTTSPEFYGCYKLSGKKLWLLHTGANMFASAHTSPFIAWDLDGDGFGEFMVKTAPGAIDGQGSDVIMSGDDPTANWKNSKGKQVSGPEYITVFDGRNGAELKTIAYHTNYAAGSSYWGDSNQNRSERYLAGIAWLDGENSNPSAIFARGYYAGAFVGAYDWDGENLTLRWLHRALSATNGEVKYANGTTTKLTSTVYGEGAHWMAVADVNGDGKQEITYGSAAIKSDGTTLYRTGLGHGDALHVSDFDPERPGLECFMVHEHSPYGMDYRDATTGALLLRKTADDDTGRGFMANFDPEREGALWQASAWANLFDASGNSVVESQTYGGGAAAQDRLYWTGTLADDFWGKSTLSTWSGSSLGRILSCVNKGNYTVGTTNNSSKNNACVIGDILGDWREEVICWSYDETNGYRLTINETNYTTDYQVPHLMDDYAYRAQVINENCCYNQPPHLGYNLRNSKKVTRELLEVEPTTEAGQQYGKYWDAFFTTYNVKIPEGVTCWSVTSASSTTGKLTMTKYTGSVLPANTAILYNASTPNVTFVPTTNTVSSGPGTARLKGAYCDSTMVDGASTTFYAFRNGDKGLGFYHDPGTKVAGRTAFLYTIGKPASMPDAMVLPDDVNPSVPQTDTCDVNGDNKVDISDVNVIIAVICGTEQNSKADVTGDGKIDVSDINRVIDTICNTVTE